MSALTSSQQVQHESDSVPPKLTYREQRRIDQEELRRKFPDRKRRGPTRGLKYASRRARNPEEKITVTFMDSVRRVVGTKADEFICDCSNWVEDICPLYTMNWAQMNSDKKDQLYSKILGKYNLPEKVDGKPVINALSFQCSTLYRHWRYRLKEKHFRGKTLAQAKDSRPLTVDKDEWDWLVFEYWDNDKQKKRSKTNTDNKLKQIEIPANGSRSTARIFYDMINEPSTISTQDLDATSEPFDNQQDPLYVRLFEKTKRHKKIDENSPWGPSGFGPNDEKHFEELKTLHETEIQKHGEDTLTVKDAYMKVLNHKSGYVRGLGPGARQPKKGGIERETSEPNVELSSEIQQLKNDAIVRETQIDTLKASNDELRASNEELRASNEELKASVSKINLEAIEREKKLRDDVQKMFDEMRRRR